MNVPHAVHSNSLCKLYLEYIVNHFQALIQISIFSTTGLRCYLFRICKFDIEECSNLMKILKSKKIIKLGLSSFSDLHSLSSFFSDRRNLRHFFTLKILSHYSEPMREGQFGRWLCPFQSAIRISMTQNLQCEKVS